MNKVSNIKPRITAGIYKNRRLTVPSSSRPVTERIKMMIFDTLSEVIKDSKFLDLFAGSGNMGFEALSRGATEVTFVDKSSKALEIIKENANVIGIDKESIKLVKKDYASFSNNIEEKFHIIFIDPPFEKADYIKLDSLFGILDVDGIIVLKMPNRNKNKHLEDFKDRLIWEKSVGRNKILIYR